MSLPDRVLVVDDEKPIADILKWNLERAGFVVSVAYTGPAAVEQALAEHPSLVILDVMLPQRDGFRVCQEIRAVSTVPVLMLTAKDAEEDKVRGLELGADDYMTKPFSPRELVARVKAILRRASSGEESAPEGMIRHGDLEVDLRSHSAKKSGLEVGLTMREFELLHYFLAHPGELIGREKLLSEVWGYEYFGDMRTVDVTVRRLREKIEDNPSDPRYILTRRGVGYLLARPEP